VQIVLVTDSVLVQVNFLRVVKKLNNQRGLSVVTTLSEAVRRTLDISDSASEISLVIFDADADSEVDSDEGQAIKFQKRIAGKGKLNPPKLAYLRSVENEDESTLRANMILDKVDFVIR